MLRPGRPESVGRPGFAAVQVSTDLMATMASWEYTAVPGQPARRASWLRNGRS